MVWAGRVTGQSYKLEVKGRAFISGYFYVTLMGLLWGPHATCPCQSFSTWVHFYDHTSLVYPYKRCISGKFNRALLCRQTVICLAHSSVGKAGCPETLWLWASWPWHITLTSVGFFPCFLCKIWDCWFLKILLHPPNSVVQVLSSLYNFLIGPPDKWPDFRDGVFLP